MQDNIYSRLAVSTPDEDDEIFAQELSAIVNDFAEQGLVTLPGDYRYTDSIHPTILNGKHVRNSKGA